jgi:hypothetical protein
LICDGFDHDILLCVLHPPMSWQRSNIRPS